MTGNIPGSVQGQAGRVGGFQGEDFKVAPTRIILGFYDSTKEIKSIAEKDLTAGLGCRKIPTRAVFFNLSSQINLQERTKHHLLQ